MTFICQGSFHINFNNITGHQCTVTISDIHKTLVITQLSDQTETILLVKHLPQGCTEFPEIFMFVEIPEYSRFGRFVVTL